MASIDIREEGTFVNKIIFADNDENRYAFFIRNEGTSSIYISNGKQELAVCEWDLDNLIKALQKAKELWVGDL
jgi:hypothetical protein